MRRFSPHNNTHAMMAESATPAVTSFSGDRLQFLQESLRKEHNARATEDDCYLEDFEVYMSVNQTQFLKAYIADAEQNKIDLEKHQYGTFHHVHRFLAADSKE